MQRNGHEASTTKKVIHSQSIKAQTQKKSFSYHINTHIVAKALVARQKVTENDSTPLWSFPGLHEDPRVDLQRTKVLIFLHQAEMIYLQLTQDLIVIILPKFKFVQCHKHTTLILTAEQLPTLIGALCEALASALFLENENKSKAVSNVLC